MPRLFSLFAAAAAQPLTAERLAEAREKWRSAAVTHYFLEIRTEGVSRYHMRVNQSQQQKTWPASRSSK